ncbi:MAG: hypothetical protein V4438_00750 [Patescibacteria group bacterium]
MNTRLVIYRNCHLNDPIREFHVNIANFPETLLTTTWLWLKIFGKNPSVNCTNFACFQGGNIVLYADLPEKKLVELFEHLKDQIISLKGEAGILPDQDWNN